MACNISVTESIRLDNARFPQQTGKCDGSLSAAGRLRTNLTTINTGAYENRKRVPAE